MFIFVSKVDAGVLRSIDHEGLCKTDRPEHYLLVDDMSAAFALFYFLSSEFFDDEFYIQKVDF